jgi:hypothetical protein
MLAGRCHHDMGITPTLVITPFYPECHLACANTPHARSLLWHTAASESPWHPAHWDGPIRNEPTIRPLQAQRPRIESLGWGQSSPRAEGSTTTSSCHLLSILACRCSPSLRAGGDKRYSEGLPSKGLSHRMPAAWATCASRVRVLQGDAYMTVSCPGAPGTACRSGCSWNSRRQAVLQKM